MAGGQFGLARMMEKREGAEWNGSSSSRDSGSGTNGKMVAGGNRRKFPSILETLRAIVFSCYSKEVFCSQFRVHGFERKPGSSPCPPQLQNSLGDLANASHTQPWPTSQGYRKATGRCGPTFLEQRLGFETLRDWRTEVQS